MITDEILEKAKRIDLILGTGEHCAFEPYVGQRNVDHLYIALNRVKRYERFAFASVDGKRVDLP